LTVTETNGRWQEEQDRRLARLEEKMDGLPQKVQALEESFDGMRRALWGFTGSLILAMLLFLLAVAQHWVGAA
jgi:hypothetical protein